MKTIYKARQIITLNPYQPTATHVAVQDGRILAVGDAADMPGGTNANGGNFRHDDRFADAVLVPGFVEGHGHASEGQVWNYPYLGYFDRYAPDGTHWPGCKSPQEVVQRLCAYEKTLQANHDEDEPLHGWGLDPIYFDRRMDTTDLDQVSKTRPIVLLHANAHLVNTNSRTLELAGITQDMHIEGIVRNAEGSITGELGEMAVMYMAYKNLRGQHPFFGTISVECLQNYAQAAANAGVTTATDLYANFDQASLANFRRATEDPNYNLRLAPALNVLGIDRQEGIALMEQLKSEQGKNPSDHLFWGLCKVMTDGSIQGFTGRLGWPGYHNGAVNGMWNSPPEQLAETVREYHRAGMHLHIHTNGDQASLMMIDALEGALNAHPRYDHRHTLQHCQMPSMSQLKRIKALGLCVNFFANHIYYWGDQHAKHTVGPQRARLMNPCKAALDLGIPLAIHSDVPVTPLNPLFSMACAMQRTTASGQVFTPSLRLNAWEALHAVTLGPAYSIKLDHLVGSIELGKYADFAVLNANPLETPPAELPQIQVHGSIIGGHFHKSKLSRA